MELLSGETAEHRHIQGLKAKLAHLWPRERRDEAQLAIDELTLEADIEAAVAAPVPGDVDPTAWLPDEILLAVLLHVVFHPETACSPVCRRWSILCSRSPQVKRRRWELYAAGGGIHHEYVKPHSFAVNALVAGHGGRVYSCSNDELVNMGNTRLQTLERHDDSVYSLAVDRNGTVYSGMADGTISVWSDVDGAHVHLRTLRGHTDGVTALAVGIDGTGTLFSGSYDATVRMWCGVSSSDSSSDSDWVPIYITLDGHGGGVSGLALTPDGNLYSGSMDGTICVWNAVDGSMTPVRTLEPAGGCGGVTAVVVGSAGTVVSGSVDGVIRVWSTLDGALRRFRASTSTSATTDRASPGITDLAVGQDGKVFAAFDNGDVCVWSCGATGINVQFSAHDVCVNAVAVRSDGKLYTAAMDKTVRVW